VCKISGAGAPARVLYPTSSSASFSSSSPRPFFRRVVGFLILLLLARSLARSVSSRLSGSVSTEYNEATSKLPVSLGTLDILPRIDDSSDESMTSL